MRGLETSASHGYLVERIRAAMLLNGDSCIECGGTCSPTRHIVDPEVLNGAMGFGSSVSTSSLFSPVVTTVSSSSTPHTTSVITSVAGVSTSCQPPYIGMSQSPFSLDGISSLSVGSMPPSIQANLHLRPPTVTMPPLHLSTGPVVTPGLSGYPGVQLGLGNLGTTPSFAGSWSGLTYTPGGPPVMPGGGLRLQQQHLQQQQYHQQQLQHQQWQQYQLQLQQQQEAQMNQFRMDQQRTLQEVQLQNRIANERMQAEFSRQMGEMLRQQSTRDEPIPSVPPLESARLSHTVTRPSSVAATTASSVVPRAVAGGTIPGGAPENPAVFGLQALAPIAAHTPSGKVNQQSLIFCGVNAGPLLSASDPQAAAKRKVLSGQHSATVDEVRSQVYFPHMVLDAVVCPTRPEYDSLTPVQFAAGYAAMTLAYMPEELNDTPMANMLKHFNRIMTFAMASDWKSVLQFNAQFLHACENHQTSFVHRSAIQAWHDRHLQSARLHNLAPRRKNDGDNVGDGEAGKKTKDPNFVPNHFIRQEKLCIKFQDGRCAETDDHQLGAATLVHACALCLF